MNANELIEKAEEFFKTKKFEEIINLISDEVLERIKEKDKTVELYTRRGTSWYNIDEFDKSILDFNSAININPKYALAFYNRGFSYIKKEEYIDAIKDFSHAIEYNDISLVDLAMAYAGRACAFALCDKYDDAIKDYDKAIDLYNDYASAYYNRGLIRIKKKGNNKELEESKKDFKSFLSIVGNKKDRRAKHAIYYMNYIDEKVSNPCLSTIESLISKIKEILLIDGNGVTHYTSLSVLKSLILENTKFRLSEGNSMNDPFEGKVFFNFLGYKSETFCDDDFHSEKFSPKPFIGSFVTQDRHDNLNMWRFYGKEGGIEAKGCSITLCAKEFIKSIKNSLLTEEEDYLKYENDITFYRIAYLSKKKNAFYVPDSNKNDELNRLMKELKVQFETHPKNERYSLEKYLNSIAFLFKDDVYENENEVRIVVTGLEFEKKRDMNIIPHRVYIELESIKRTVKKITLGPKVDKAHEWASIFHYNDEENPPEIVISHLPYQ